jgi:putative acetyltransferase
MFSIENIIPEDFYEVTDVWEDSVRMTHHFLNEIDVVILRNAILKTYLPVAENLFCVRNRERRIIAFMGIDGENIDMLFIHSSERGKGLGKRLIQFAIDKFHISTVDANEENEQAVGFYLKMGFEVISREEIDSTGKPHPILHMKLKME